MAAGNDMKRLLRDKRVWAGAGVVAAIAVVMAIRNRSGGGGAVAGSGANPAAPSGYYQATGDTTGTDLSGFLSNWGQAHLSASQSGFQSILDALKATGTDTGAQNDVATFEHGNHLDVWLQAINAAHPGLNLTTDKFKQLNPGISIQQGNAFGFIGSSNPANRPGGGAVYEVFGGPGGTVKIR